MLPTTHNSIVFPDTLPNEALDFFNQMLSFDIQLLLLNKQLEQCNQLDKKKVEIDKKEKELLKEKNHISDQLDKLNKKSLRLDMAITNFLAKSSKIYKKTNFSSVRALTELLSAYKDEDGNVCLIDILNEDKDEIYSLTNEKKDFLIFVRNQDEANIHYKNKLENSKKGDELNFKTDELNKMIRDFNKNIYTPYQHAVNNYNQLKEKKNLVASQKEKVFNEFLEKMDDASLQEYIEQLVQSFRQQNSHN